MIASRAVHFISVETQIAGAFADMVGDCNDEEERQRKFERARENYRTALDFLQKPDLAPDQRNELSQRLEHVKAKLAELRKGMPGCTPA
ncbi:MAG TPA: hypothetical protein VFS68_10905 [Candidatus Udaeobacter sp.]|nr:hypothetical protein [Candidatus Udaeobacter sp.]